MSIGKHLACVGFALAVAGAPAVAQAQSLNFGSLGPGEPSQPAPPAAPPSWKDQPIAFKAFAVKQWRGVGKRNFCYSRVSIDLSYLNSDLRWFSMYPDIPYGELYAVNDTTGEEKYLNNTGGDGRFSGGIISSFGIRDQAFPTGETSIVRMEVRTRDGEVLVLGSAPVTIPAECPLSDEEALAEYGPNQTADLARDITPEGLTLTRE